MTFGEYISNPMGRKSAVFSHREMYNDMYTKKLNELMVRENGKVVYELYNNKDFEFFAHIKIPSETVPDFYYDTVIMLYPRNKASIVDRSLKDYNVKFYSNDPSFVYTFAHSFLANDLFIKDLVPRMSKEAVKKVAKERNPSNEVGYVKSIFFAYLIMNRYGLFNKVQYETYGKPYKKKELLSNVIHSEDKIYERQVKGEDIRKKKSRERKASKKNNKPKTVGDMAKKKGGGSIRYTPKSKTAKRTTTAKTVKRK